MRCDGSRPELLRPARLVVLNVSFGDSGRAARAHIAGDDDAGSLARYDERRRPASPVLAIPVGERVEQRCALQLRHNGDATAPAGVFPLDTFALAKVGAEVRVLVPCGRLEIAP